MYYLLKIIVIVVQKLKAILRKRLYPKLISNIVQNSILSLHELVTNSNNELERVVNCETAFEKFTERSSKIFS